MSSAKGNTLFEDFEVEGYGIVALTIGAPGERQLKEAEQIILEATQSKNLLGDEGPSCGSLLQYGPRCGTPRFRELLAKFLSKSYNDNINSDQLFVTSGATSGLFLMASLLFSSQATVFVEDPTYFLAIGMLRDDIGLNIVPVPTDAGGIKTDVLATLLEQNKVAGDQTRVSEDKPFSAMVYLVSIYNNPRGTCLSAERSRQLVELARKFNVLLFADDVYNLLHYDDTCSHAPPRLLAYDNKDDAEYKGHVISNGSFSKIFAPGVRLGWIESGDRIIKLLKNSATSKSAGCFNQFTAEVIATSLRLGLQQRHLDNLKSVYSTRVKSVAQKLRENLPECVTFEVPRGGYFFWLQMPDGALAEKVAKDVNALHKIMILPGNRCSPTGQSKNCIRISFAHYEEPVLLDAVQKLSDVITKHVAGNPGEK